MPFASGPLLFDCGGYQLLLPNHLCLRRLSF